MNESAEVVTVEIPLDVLLRIRHLDPVLEVAVLEAERKMASKALRREVEAMLERGEPPERYSERKDRKEYAKAFLARVYGRYLAKDNEVIYLHEIRRLDPKFANSLQIACLRSGEPVWLSVPKRSDLTDRTLAAAGKEKVNEITKAVSALARRKRAHAHKNQ